MKYMKWNTILWNIDASFAHSEDEKFSKIIAYLNMSSENLFSYSFHYHCIILHLTQTSCLVGEPHNHDNPNVQIQDVTYGKLKMIVFYFCMYKFYKHSNYFMFDIFLLMDAKYNHSKKKRWYAIPTLCMYLKVEMIYFTLTFWL